MDLSIVIVSWNTRELLRDCLASLPAATAELATEIVVVDNASADGSADMVVSEFPAVRLMESGGNLGFARANNLALPHTTGHAVLLLNPDTICPPGSLARLFRFAVGRPGVGAAAPRLVDEDGHPTLSWGFFPRARDHWLGFLDPRRIWLRGALSQRISTIPRRSDPSCRVDYVTGACFMIPRTSLEQVGNLDERFFMYFEETDWCWRSRDAGLDVWYCAETEVTHLEGRAAGQVGDFSLRQFQASYRLFLEKHQGKRAVLRFRLAQFAEYGWKSLLRRLAPGEADGNRALARVYADRARLQLRGSIEVAPPS
ncbi:glycosyltransferase family 2 protein [bacterium]|nr:MAG: glycosyltransferase family 2 protein [bacterium]